MMRVLAFVILLTGYTLAHTMKSKPLYKMEEANDLFENFMTEFKKNYNGGEKQKKFEIFKENLKIINNKNKDANEHAVFGINKFSDLSPEEFLARHTGLRPAALGGSSGVHLTDTHVKTDNAPDAIDWREKNVVTPVKEQAFCGSCWAFSATGNVEGQHAIKTGELISLSEQQLVDCASNSGCEGGEVTQAFDYLSYVKGQQSEEGYPYEGSDGYCRSSLGKIVAPVTGYDVYYLNDEEKVKELVGTVGPMSIGLDASALKHYDGGILKDCPFVDINHAVLLVGYGTENDVPFWIIKNSWGEWFGENGYARVVRGNGSCGFLHSPVTTAVVEV